MTISSLATLLAFLLLVAPGLWADLLELKRRAGAKESTFREAGRVALFSLVCSAIGAFTVGTTLNRTRDWTGFDALKAVHDPKYAAEHFWWSVSAVAATSLVGCVAATLIQWWRLGSLRTKVRQVSAWTAELDKAKNEPKGTRTDVQVELLSGDRYIGALAGFTPNIEQADRELTLAQPMWAMREGAKEVTEVPDRYERLVLRGDQIKTVAARKWVPPSVQDDGSDDKRYRVRLPGWIVSLRATIKWSRSQTSSHPHAQENPMNRTFSGGAVATLVIGLILYFAVSAPAVSLGSLALDLGTVGLIFMVVGAMLLSLSLLPRRVRAHIHQVDPASRESVTDHQPQI